MYVCECVCVCVRVCVDKNKTYNIYELAWCVIESAMLSAARKMLTTHKSAC